MLIDELDDDTMAESQEDISTENADDVSNVNDNEDDEPGNGEYTPNYTYRFRNEDLEFDEFIKPVINSLETEEQIRELYTRSKGLDNVKTRFEETRQRMADLELETQRYKEENEFATQGIEGLKKLALDDFPSFAHIIGLDDKTVLSYANRRLDYQEKPEHERAEIDREMTSRASQYTQTLELEKLRRQNEGLMRAQHEKEMSHALSMPEISKFQSVFDKRMGKDGTFMDYVRQHGSNEFKRTKQYVPPLVAVQSVYNQFKPLFMDALDEVSNKEEANSSGAKKKAPRNLGPGRSTTPVNKKYKSLDDLRKRANELARAQARG